MGVSSPSEVVSVQASCLVPFRSTSHSPNWIAHLGSRARIPLVNPSDGSRTVTADSDFHRIAGRQAPAMNDILAACAGAPRR